MNAPSWWLLVIYLAGAVGGGLGAGWLLDRWWWGRQRLAAEPDLPVARARLVRAVGTITALAAMTKPEEGNPNGEGGRL